MRRAITTLLASVLLVTAAAASSASARAQGPSPACGPPRCVREHVVFQGHDLSVNVLLPSGYQTSTRRYPVLFLLPLGGFDQDVWLARSALASFTAQLPDQQQAIVVMPFAGPLGNVDIGDWRFEAFDVDRLIPHIDATYRTIADRRHRAVAGGSNGATGAFILAARHPDLFAAAGGLSGAAYDLTEESPVKEAFWFASVSALLDYCRAFGGHDPAGICLGVYDPHSLTPLPNPVGDELGWHSLSPTDLAINLNGLSVYIGAATGVPCDTADATELATGMSPFQAYEPMSRRETEQFHRALATAGVAHTADFLPCGTHAIRSFRYLNRQLEAFWNQMIGQFGRPDPSAFDYRRAAPAFSAWGWRFTADRRRAAEFLDIGHASSHGLTLTGSGIETVTTAASFAPGETVSLTGARESSAPADSDGRITFTVDLGPAHPNQQYTAQANLAGENSPGYFVTKAVRFSQFGEG